MIFSITVALIGIFITLFFLPDFKMFKRHREWWSMFVYFTLVFLTVALVFQIAVAVGEFFKVI